MIIFFFDRFWNPLGKASAKLPKGVTYYDDHEVEDVETCTSTFEVYVGFDEENRNIVRAYGQEATYFVTTDQEGHGRLWSVIDDESDEEAMFHYFYGEDAGMDLINEMLPAWGSPGSAKPIVYYIERAAADSGFEIGINEIPNLTRTLEWDGEATGLNRLQSIFTQFDNAELQFRFDIDENTLELKHKYIDILKKRGNDTGIELRMNREVKNIRMKRSRANMFNAYRCYGATPEGKENPITLNGYSLTTAQKEINPETGKARFVLSGNILKDTESNAKYSRYLNPYEQGEDEGYYTGIYNSEATTQNALANETILQLKKTGYPEVNYEVDVIDAPRTLKAGDYVSIVNDKDELYLEGRILKTDRSRSNDTFEITLGDYLIRDSGIAEQIQAMADKLKGKDGVSNFIFYAYADDDKGTGFSLNPQGKKYTGLTVSLVNQQPSDPSVYTWSLSKGSDGQPGKPGETYHPHKAWMMADGTFTKVYPNENLFRNSESPNAIAYAGATSTKTANVSVPEWNAATAVKYAISGGTSTIACTMPAGSMTTAGVKENYDISIYIKNTGTVDFNIGGNITTSTRIEAGEAKWVTFLAKDYSHPTGAARQFSITRLSVGAAIEFIVWRAKFAYGTYNSIWTPRPDEDYENAYPKWEGFYSDTNQVGSDNPDDYKPWTPFMGPQGKDGYTPVKNVDYFDGQPGQNGKSAYLWIRYSQNADGSGMTTDPANAKYTGYATTETNVAPTSPSVYKWQQTKGDPGIGIPGEPGPDGKTSYLHIKYSNDGGLTFTGNGGEDGGDYIGQYVDFTEADSTKPSDYTWSLTKGSKGDKGDPAPLISLSGSTQAITVDKDGKITPASSFSVTGTAVNTAISNWTYSLNGGNFGSAVPTGVTRSGNTVTINPVTATFDTFTIKAADATVSDVFTISRIKDGGEGPPGADAYTVFLTNESYTFAGSTTAALAGSTTTEVIVYKGINKITPTSITVGTKPTGLSSSVSGSIITLTATTALVSKSGIVPITIIADGKTFTKQFSYALSLQGGKGDPGDPGKGVAAEEISYAISQDGTTPPTSGWSGTRPTPKAGWYMWTRTRFKYTDNTYSAYFYLVAQQGKDAIVISDTAPANPTKGTLWQDSSVVPQIIKVFDGTAWSMWGMPIDNLLATNILSENGVFKRLEGAEIVNTFSYTDSGVTYTGTTTMKDGNVTISRTGSDGSTWTTTMDRVQGFVDTYKSGPSAPSRVTQLGQGKLYMVEAGVGGYLPAAALNPASWTNLSYASGFTTAENNPCQYRKVQLVDGSWELQLRGQIKPTSGDFSTSASPTGGILPAGFRPTRNELVPAADSTKKGARVVVLSTGEIQINTPNGGNYVSFGGIRIAL
ncbi:phage tail protein [Enterococcus casseliflavus]|uniref:phage tail protein n=1 Tax=Enterococcus casseliflavus TaxID=37734 RepID=UPI003DA5B8A2